MKDLPGMTGMDPKDAQQYIIDKLNLKPSNTTKNRITKCLLKYKPVRIHPKLYLVGFKNEDVESALNDYTEELIKKADKVFDKAYSGKKMTIEDFSTKSYRFNRIYNKDGTPTQYTKMIEYIRENGFGEAIDVIAAGKYNEGVAEFDKLDLNLPLDKFTALKRYGGGIVELSKVGVLKCSLGEVMEGINFGVYEQFILKKEQELSDSGVKVKKY